MELTKALKEYGLSENEIKVYLALIKLGKASVQKIAKSSCLPRTTSYHLLESLEQKGLVGFVIKDSKRYFSVARPSKLVENLEEKKKIIQEIIPELNSLSESITEKPGVTIFEGVRGVRAILKDVLEERKTIYHYGDINSIQEVFAHVFPQYISERVKRKIAIKVICKKKEAHKDLIKNAKKEFREFAFIPKSYHFDSSVFIYANKVAIFNIKHEPYFVVVINNKDFYNTQKNFFELMWKLLKT